MHQRPYEGLVLAEEKGVKVDPAVKQQIFEGLLADEKGYVKAKDLVDRGIIDINNPAAIDLLLQSANGKFICYTYVMEGKIKLTEKIAMELIKNKQIANSIEALYVNDTGLDANFDTGFTKEKLKEAIDREHQITNDADLLHAKAFNLGDKFGSTIADSAARVESGKIDPNNKIDAALDRLKARDPIGYGIIKENAATLDNDYMQSIIQGNKIEFTNSEGKKVTAYEGGYIAEGGMGVVHHVAFVVEGSNKLQYQVIKRAHKGRETFFEGDKQSAGIVKEWDSPYLNKALQIGPDVIIYETGANAGDMSKRLPQMSNYDAVKVMIDALKGVKVYQDKGFIHADLKPWNILVTDGPNGPQGQLIDNNPTTPQKLANGESPFTPTYTNPFVYQTTIANSNPKDYVAFDNYSMGVTIKQMLVEGIRYTDDKGVTHMSVPERGIQGLEPIISKLTDFPGVSNPNTINEVIAHLEGMLPGMSKNIPGQKYVFDANVDSNAKTPVKAKTDPAAPLIQ